MFADLISDQPYIGLQAQAPPELQQWPPTWYGAAASHAAPAESLEATNCQGEGDGSIRVKVEAAEEQPTAPSWHATAGEDSMALPSLPPLSTSSAELFAPQHLTRGIARQWSAPQQQQQSWDWEPDANPDTAAAGFGGSAFNGHLGDRLGQSSGLPSKCSEPVSAETHAAVAGVANGRGAEPLAAAEPGGSAELPSADQGELPAFAAARAATQGTSSSSGAQLESEHQAAVQAAKLMPTRRGTPAGWMLLDLFLGSLLLPYTDAHCRFSYAKGLWGAVVGVVLDWCPKTWSGQHC